MESRSSSASSANLRVSDLNVPGVGSDGINFATTACRPLSSSAARSRSARRLGFGRASFATASADTTGNTAILGDIVTNCSGETVNTASASAQGSRNTSVQCGELAAVASR